MGDADRLQHIVQDPVAGGVDQSRYHTHGDRWHHERQNGEHV